MIELEHDGRERGDLVADVLEILGAHLAVVYLEETVGRPLGRHPEHGERRDLAEDSLEALESDLELLPPLEKPLDGRLEGRDLSIHLVEIGERHLEELIVPRLERQGAHAEILHERRDPEAHPVYLRPNLPSVVGLETLRPLLLVVELDEMEHAEAHDRLRHRIDLGLEDHDVNLVHPFGRQHTLIPSRMRSAGGCRSRPCPSCRPFRSES